MQDNNLPMPDTSPDITKGNVNNPTNRKNISAGKYNKATSLLWTWGS